MSSQGKKTCLVCQKEVCKLSRHLKLMHPGITQQQTAELVVSQRKRRTDCKTSNSRQIEYRLCSQLKENGERCDGIIQKQGFHRHLNEYHSIKSRSGIGKMVTTNADMRPIYIKQCVDEATTNLASEIATQPPPPFVTHLSDEETVDFSLNINSISETIDNDQSVDAMDLFYKFDNEQILNVCEDSNALVRGDTTTEPTNSYQLNDEGNIHFSPTAPCPELDIKSPPDTTMYFTPELELLVENKTCAISASANQHIPNLDPKVIIPEYTDWLSSMDGGGQSEDACKQAKLVISNILSNISINEIKNPAIVCKYFTEKQKNHKLSAGSVNVYLRHFSSFLLYIHQKYPKLVNSEDHGQLDERISRRTRYSQNESRI